MAALTAFTPYAWFVCQVSPDIFVGYFALALIGYLLIIGISMLVHNSILLLGLVVVGIVWVCWSLKYKKWWNRKFATLALSTVAMYLVVASVNQVHHQQFVPNPSSHVFILSRIAETGILNDVMAKECDVKQYQICDSFTGFEGRQWDFMWHGNYPHNKHGWLDQNVTKDYNAIIKTTFTTPKYLLSFLKVNIIDGFKTLFDVKINDGIKKFTDGTSPWNNIKAFYPRNFHSFIEAKQQTNVALLSFDLMNKVVNWGLLFLTLGMLLWYIRVDKENSYKQINILGILLLVWLFNALITTTLSTYMGRFNARLIWVLPLGLLLAILKSKHHTAQEIKTSLN